MCGIFGWVFNEPPPGLETVALCLATSNDSRGGHGWGYYARRTGKDDLWQRGTGRMVGSTSLHRMASYSQLLGHNRYATIGEKNYVNAHPFLVGDVVGAHNGGISNHLALNRKYERTFTVDSQHIFAQLEDGLDLSELRGYGAVEFLRRSVSDRIFLFTFNHNDLHVAHIKFKGGNEGCLWSSTESALRSSMAAAMWRGYTVFADLADDRLYAATAKNLYKYDKPRFTITQSYVGTSYSSSCDPDDEEDDRAAEVAAWTRMGRVERRQRHARGKSRGPDIRVCRRCEIYAQEDAAQWVAKCKLCDNGTFLSTLGEWTTEDHYVCVDGATEEDLELYRELLLDSGTGLSSLN